MPKDIYATVAGIVQFDVNEREYSGQKLRDFVVQAIGSGGKSIRITVWQEFEDTDINKGDYVVAQGKFTQKTIKGKEYLNLNARDLVVVPAAPRRERAVENEVEVDENARF